MARRRRLRHYLRVEERRTPAPEGTLLSQRLLREHRRLLFHFAFSQIALLWYVSQHRWFWAAVWAALMLSNVWALMCRAAGIRELPARTKRREEMTPREAFWLAVDPRDVFDRERRRSVR